MNLQGKENIFVDGDKSGVELIKEQKENNSPESEKNNPNEIKYDLAREEYFFWVQDKKIRYAKKQAELYQEKAGIPPQIVTGIFIRYFI